MHTTRALTALTLLLPLAGCELEEERPVMGNFDVHYADDLRVYINDELVADVRSGEDARFEWNGQELQVSRVCSDDGVVCPAESWWGSVAVDQPWGTDQALLNFVNLDEAHGDPGVRMGGVLDVGGDFQMLSGLALSAGNGCAALGVGTVQGHFNDPADAVEDGLVIYTWAAGCDIDGVEIGGELRLESSFTATRTGDYDISSVQAEAPIDEEGEEVDPSDPAPGYSLSEDGRPGR